MICSYMYLTQKLRHIIVVLSIFAEFVDFL